VPEEGWNPAEPEKWSEQDRKKLVSLATRKWNYAGHAGIDPRAALESLRAGEIPGGRQRA
jgi:hypothetical protein